MEKPLLWNNFYTPYTCRLPLHISAYPNTLNTIRNAKLAAKTTTTTSGTPLDLRHDHTRSHNSRPARHRVRAGPVSARSSLDQLGLIVQSRSHSSSAYRICEAGTVDRNFETRVWTRECVCVFTARGSSVCVSKRGLVHVCI